MKTQYRGKSCIVLVIMISYGAGMVKTKNIPKAVWYSLKFCELFSSVGLHFLNWLNGALCFLLNIFTFLFFVCISAYRCSMYQAEIPVIVGVPHLVKTRIKPQAYTLPEHSISPRLFSYLHCPDHQPTKVPDPPCWCACLLSASRTHNTQFSSSLYKPKQRRCWRTPSLWFQFIV